jgi:PhnB protein
MAVKPIPDQYHSLQPYLLVEGAADLIRFLQATFDAEEALRMPQPDGRIGHAEMRVGDSMVMLADASTAEGSGEPMPSTVMTCVADADATYRRALEAGATSLREPTDMFYGDRSAGVVDPSVRQPLLVPHAHRRRLARGGGPTRAGTDGRASR